MPAAVTGRLQRNTAIWFTVVILALTGCSPSEPTLPVETQILRGDIEPVSYRLNNFALNRDGYVLGSRGKTLSVIVKQGTEVKALHTFEHRINGIHVMIDGTVIVATDDDYRNPDVPCIIYRSDHNGTFKPIKRIHGGSALSWSFASDKNGNLYVGEYGPTEPDMSKTVWQSPDRGKTWTVAFQAPNRAGVHVHRVAVDPYTNDVWVTIGDGEKNRGIHRSTDEGKTWQRVLDSQATGVAFTEDAIYWGEDESGYGRVTRYDRNSGTARFVLDVSEYGNYSGSAYDLVSGAHGTIYAPFMKYEDQNHAASLWAGRDATWHQLMILESRPGQGTGAANIGGPDRFGFLYIPGYRIRDVE
ncbi:MAG: hypothetical protein QNI91_02580 [Arenicellales bacterium]|nr:hypothetical protein [Arenicellales bacterium]